MFYACNVCEVTERSIDKCHIYFSVSRTFDFVIHVAVGDDNDYSDDDDNNNDYS